MKFLSGIYLTYLQSRSSRRNLKILIRFLLLLIAVIFGYSTLFHVLMEAFPPDLLQRDAETAREWSLRAGCRRS